MSVTVHQSPSAYTPAFNPQWFVATSTQIGAPGFIYRVICTDLITSETQTFNIKQRPTSGELVFPAHIFSEKYAEHYVPNNEYNFQLCTDGIRKIRVNIGEYYSSTYYPGTNQDYIIWNGVLRPLDWTTYDYTDFVYNSDDTNLKYLSSLTPTSGKYMRDCVTYDGKSSFIYFLTQTAGDVQSLDVTTYDENGTILGTYSIANPYQSSYTYTNKYFCIDVGHKGLSNTSPPMITANVAYYDVSESSFLGSPASQSVQQLKRITINCENNFTVYTLHYLAKSGNFETLHFAKSSEFRERAEKKYYRINPNSLVSNTYSYSKFTEWEKAMSSTGTENILINTDWMDEDEVAGHREIVTSSKVYIDYGSTTGLVPCKVLTSEILVNKSYNNKLFAIALEIEPTYKNNYQRG